VPLSAADAALRDQVLLDLAPLPVTARPMFGGVGFYLEGVYFGIIAGGIVYFRTDDESRAVYVERGMPAFQPANRPRGPKTVDKNFRVPDDVLVDPPALREWAMRAAAARR
jgi:DNA transformation protein and related proteins